MAKLFLSILLLGKSFGYDEYTSCDSQSRGARRLVLPKSCDLVNNNFCYEKGQDYPDKSIRRFLKENLGLMKRMSSDMDSREVVREMRSGFNMWTQEEHYDEEEFLIENEDTEPDAASLASNFQLNMMPPGENIFNGLKYNIKYGSGLATIKNVRDESLSREAETEETTSTTRTTTSQTTMIVTTHQSTSSDLGPETQTQTSPPSVVTTVRKDTTNEYIEPSTVTEQFQTSTVMDSTEQETTYEMESRETPTEPPMKIEPFYPDEYYSDYVQPEEAPFQSPLVQEPVEEYIEEVIEEVLEDNSLEESNYIEEVLDQVVEEPEVIDYTGESVNACEVDVSITAPYWATNTRNDSLALLNLYPFEQYIHMEICKAEHDEMLCRPGCRCEQQYRLHRLLAFDPTNECRGIFSDWFRFPSFCICKCYNSVRQFKEFTRNPKSHKLAQKQSKKVEKDTDTSQRNSGRLSNHRLMTMSGMEGMPAVFPYEGLAMITDEQNQKNDEAEVRVPRGMNAPMAIKTEIEVEKPQEVFVEKIADEHMDNTVESDLVHNMKKVKHGRYLDDSFFYNQPIVDFALSDGTMGSVEQVPRKK